jgi:hypothetical protein
VSIDAVTPGPSFQPPGPLPDDRACSTHAGRGDNCLRRYSGTPPCSQLTAQIALSCAVAPSCPDEDHKAVSLGNPPECLRAVQVHLEYTRTRGRAPFPSALKDGAPWRLFLW